MAQQRVVRHFAMHGHFKRIDVVDSFSGERAFFEQVLVHIRNRRSVRIDAARAREDGFKERLLMVSDQRMRDSRLHNSIAFHDPPGANAEPGLIEGMRHGADQTARYASRHPRVPIKRDDVSDTRRSFYWDSSDGKKSGVGSAAEQLVQFTQLSSLALPSHPFALALVPNAPSM